MKTSANATILSPEYNVLIRCARRSLQESDVENLQELLRCRLDWDLLLQLAEGQGLLPLLSEHLAEIKEGLVLPEILSRLRDANRECALRALLLSAELNRLVEEFERRGIPAVPHKGPVLAARTYGSPTLRQYTDLDFVVPQRLMPAVFDEMVKLGYGARLPCERFAETKASRIPGEYAFRRGPDGILVEFHTERTLRYFPVAPNLEEMIRRATTITLNGKEVPAFSREDELLMLAVHGAKDSWARLIWIVDIAELVKLPASIQWTTLFTRADEMRIGRMLRLAICLAHEILDLPLPLEVQGQIKRDRVASRLSLEVRNDLFANAQAFDGILRRSVYRIRCVEGPWSGMRYWIRLATAPAEEDWSAMDVPQALARSYSVLRPLRLWKKYSRSSQQSG